MSESILKALMQMFALIVDVSYGEGISGKSKDIVRLFLVRHLNSELVSKYMGIFEEYLLASNSESIDRGSLKEKKRTSLTAMRILAICEKINEELHQNQKIYVIVQVMDFILFNAHLTEKELDFLNTVSAAFNIPLSDFQNIRSFILSSYSTVPDKNKVMIIDNENECDDCGYTWYPRGHYVSKRCPSCSSTQVCEVVSSNTLTYLTVILLMIGGLFLFSGEPEPTHTPVPVAEVSTIR